MLVIERQARKLPRGGLHDCEECAPILYECYQVVTVARPSIVRWAEPELHGYVIMAFTNILSVDVCASFLPHKLEVRDGMAVVRLKEELVFAVLARDSIPADIIVNGTVFVNVI